MSPRRLRFGVGLAAIVLAVLAAGAARASDAYECYQPFPQGETGLSRPVIGQLFRFQLMHSVDSVEMWLDDQPVDAEFDSDTGYVSYVPPAPLAPGPHRVRLVVRVSWGPFDYQPLNESFEFTVAPDAVDSLPGEDPEDRVAKDCINVLRTRIGLAGLRFDPGLSLSAHRHAALIAGDLTADAHTEDSLSPSFTGETALDRANYFGYYLSTQEVVNWLDHAEDSVDAWMATLYHRLPLIDGDWTIIGYGHAAAARPASVSVLSRVPKCPVAPSLETSQEALFESLGYPPGYVPPARLSDAIAWPYPGQVGVPTSWPGLEHPDPLRFRPDATGPVGYTVTCTFLEAPDHLSLSSATLTGPDGVPVECLTFSPETDEWLADAKDTVALLPLRPLAPNTTYKAEFTGLVDQGEGERAFDHEWSFTTGPGQIEAGPNPLVRLVSVGGKVTCQFEDFAIREGVSVFLGGLPVRNLEILSRTSLAFSVPAGFPGGPAELVFVSEDGHEETFGGGVYPSSPGTPPAFTRTWWRPSSLLAGSKAFIHAGGTVMVPLSVLEAYGAEGCAPDGGPRFHWVLGDHQGTVTLGRPVCVIDGARLVLCLPVREFGGEPYAPVEFVERLLEAASRFLDTRGHWAETSINELAERRIVSGCGGALFRPEDGLTRAAFTKMLVTAMDSRLGVSRKPGDTCGFTDVNGHWLVSSGYLRPAVSCGIIRPEDFPDGRLNPDDEITRDEMAVMIVRAMGLAKIADERTVTVGADGRALIGEKAFRDARSWSKPGYVAVAIEWDIIRGYGESDGTFTFRPEGSATRAEACVMVHRMMVAMGLATR